MGKYVPNPGELLICDGPELSYDPSVNRNARPPQRDNEQLEHFINSPPREVLSVVECFLEANLAVLLLYSWDFPRSLIWTLLNRTLFANCKLNWPHQLIIYLFRIQIYAKLLSGLAKNRLTSTNDIRVRFRFVLFIIRLSHKWHRKIIIIFRLMNNTNTTYIFNIRMSII